MGSSTHSANGVRATANGEERRADGEGRRAKGERRRANGVCAGITLPFSPFAFSKQLVRVSEGCRSRPRRDVELVEDVREVAVDRLLAQVELRGDRLVRLARGDEEEDLELARCEAMRPRDRGAGRERVEALEVGRRAELFEDRLRAVDPEAGAVLVAECAAGEPREQ